MYLTLGHDSSRKLKKKKKMAWLLLANSFKGTWEYSTGLKYLNEQHSVCNIQPTVRCGYMQKKCLEAFRGSSDRPAPTQSRWNATDCKRNGAATRKMRFIDLGPSNSPTPSVSQGAARRRVNASPSESFGYVLGIRRNTHSFLYPEPFTLPTTAKKEGKTL